MPAVIRGMLLVLIACGSAHTTSPTAPPSAPGTPPPHDDSGAQPVRTKGASKVAQPVSDAPPPPCAATFGASTGTCLVEQECAYPEGTCRCEEPGHCSGANLPRPAEPLQWSCVKPPPAVRPDGCPGVEPHGTACKPEGKQCTYGACCVSVLTCEDGHWLQKKPTECPP